MQIISRFSLVIITSCILFFSCSSDDTETASVQVILVDAPAEYESVNIEIIDVQYKVDSDTSDAGVWRSLENFEANTYDLLTLTNGEEAFLGDMELSEGRLGQIRLILGEENTVTVDGSTTTLTVPSGSQSGLKLNIQTDLVGGITYRLVIDFDAAKSIVESGNSGRFNLKPVIRAAMEAQTGAIGGVVSPANTETVVYAVMNDDSISTYTDENGEFLIRALEAGDYLVTAVPSEESGLTAAFEENVSVVVGEVTMTDTLKLEN